jgi:nitrite reductase (NADH) small subunit
MAEFVTVAKVGEIRPGWAKTVELDGVPVAVFNLGDRYCAINDTCPHAGGPLSEGALEGDSVVVCPWHGWSFDLHSGKCVALPDVVQPTHEVVVDGDEVKLKTTD